MEKTVGNHFLCAIMKAQKAKEGSGYEKIRSQDGNGGHKERKNALAVYGGLTDQDPELVGSFDSREQALECYKNVYTGVKDCGNGRYEHDCKWIEVNEYDEDGEWVGGGDWTDLEFSDADGEADE